MELKNMTNKELTELISKIKTDIELEKRKESQSKEYKVKLEYKGYAYITVVASSEEEAKQIAREDIDYDDITFNEVDCSIVEG